MSEEQPDLVASLENELASLAAADADLERDAEAADRTRIERGGVVLADRLRAARAPVDVAVAGAARHSGLVREVGTDWVLLGHVPSGQSTASAEHLVTLAQVVAVRGLGRIREPRQDLRPPRSRASVLRAWCRDRAQISVLLTDGSVLTGLASAAFGDHLEVSTGGGEVIVVPTWAIAVVSR